MKFLLCVCVLLSFSFNDAKAETQTQLIQNYLKVQKALVSGDFENFKTSAKLLQESSEETGSEWKKELKELAGVSSLKIGREEFKDVSSLILKKHEDAIKDDLIVVYCPMAGAKWVQEKGKIANPYMEKDMTECGEKI